MQAICKFKLCNENKNSRALASNGQCTGHAVQALFLQVETGVPLCCRVQFSTVLSEAIPCVHVTRCVSIDIDWCLNLNAANELQLLKVFSVKLPTVLICQKFFTVRYVMSCQHLLKLKHLFITVTVIIGKLKHSFLLVLYNTRGKS